MCREEAVHHGVLHMLHANWFPQPSKRLLHQFVCTNSSARLPVQRRRLPLSVWNWGVCAQHAPQHLASSLQAAFNLQLFFSLGQLHGLAPSVPTRPAAPFILNLAAGGLSRAAAFCRECLSCKQSCAGGSYSDEWNNEEFKPAAKNMCREEAVHHGVLHMLHANWFPQPSKRLLHQFVCTNSSARLPVQRRRLPLSVWNWGVCAQHAPQHLAGGISLADLIRAGSFSQLTMM